MINKIHRSNLFKRDYKRELKGRYSQDIELLVQTVITYLMQGQPLPREYKDHAVLAEWENHRECHLKPNLLLVYRVVDNELQLARLGSHTRIFLKL